MKTIKLPSFEVAVYQKGDENADKLMLCLPGRLDSKDYAHMHSHVDYFSERGYLALSFDPPGTWGSGDDIENYTTTNYLQAMRELVEHFGNRPTVLLGHSRGGSMAMLGNSRITSVTHMISVMSNISPSSVSQEVLDAGVYISNRDLPENPEEFITFHMPLTYFKDGEQYDFTEAVADNNKPKLFMYGTQDQLVTSEDVRTGYHQFAADPKELHELDCEHDYRKYPAIISEVNERAEKFLQDYAN